MANSDIVSLFEFICYVITAMYYSEYTSNDLFKMSELGLEGAKCSQIQI